MHSSSVPPLPARASNPSVGTSTAYAPSEADPYVRRRKWAPHEKLCCALPFARKLCLDGWRFHCALFSNPGFRLLCTY